MNKDIEQSIRNVQNFVDVLKAKMNDLKGDIAIANAMVETLKRMIESEVKK